MINHPNIRLECLRPAEDWTQPTGEEIREVLRLAGLTGGRAAKVLGLGAKGVGSGKSRKSLMRPGRCCVT
jgi:hypothetical protein